MRVASSPVEVLALGRGQECRGAVGVPSAHAEVCDLAVWWVIWRRAGCVEGEGPGAKLASA
jgi:hypothetical protein